MTLLEVRSSPAGSGLFYADSQPRPRADRNALNAYQRMWGRPGKVVDAWEIPPEKLGETLEKGAGA